MKKSMLLLLLPAYLLVACSKDELSAKEKYAPRLNRDFTWHRNYLMTGGAQGDTAYSLPDTVIPLHVVTTDSLSFMGATFSFVNESHPDLHLIVDDSQKLLYADMDRTDYHSYCTIAYYYHNDSVVFTDYSGGRGGYGVLTYTSSK